MTITTATGQWKRYPNRPGRARFQAYYTPVEILAREMRKETKVRIEIVDGAEIYERFEGEDEWVRIKPPKGRTKWVRSRDVVED